MIIALSGHKNSGIDTVGKIIKYLSCGADEALIPFEKWDRDPVWGTTDN